MASTAHSGTVVEKTPNHDPAVHSYTAWTSYGPPKGPVGTPPSANNRPMFSIQIYDTTPAAASEEHVKRMCQYIHEATEIARDITGRSWPDRIELHGLPSQSNDEPNEVTARRCRDHHMAERAARHATGRPDFYISGNPARKYDHRILVIDKTLEDLEGIGEGAYPQKTNEMDADVPNPGPQGGFWTTSWGLRDSWVRYYTHVSRDYPEEKKTEMKPEELVSRSECTIASEMGDLRDSIQGFYDNYLMDGGVKKELKEAQAAHASRDRGT